MAALVLNTLKSQLPMLVEKFEPEIEGKLRESLRTIKTSHPEEASIFLMNWTKLNNAVQAELSTPAPPTMGGKKRKTRKHKKRT